MQPQCLGDGNSHTSANKKRRVEQQLCGVSLKVQNYVFGLNTSCNFCKL